MKSIGQPLFHNEFVVVVVIINVTNIIIIIDGGVLVVVEVCASCSCYFYCYYCYHYQYFSACTERVLFFVSSNNLELSLQPCLKICSNCMVSFKILFDVFKSINLNLAFTCFVLLRLALIYFLCYLFIVIFIFFV